MSGNYTQALKTVDEQLAFWPKFLVHKCKQRLTRLTQVRVRALRLAKEEERLGEKTVARLAPKVRRREETRERKAEAAAKSRLRYVVAVQQVTRGASRIVTQP